MDANELRGRVRGWGSGLGARRSGLGARAGADPLRASILLEKYRHNVDIYIYLYIYIYICICIYTYIYIYIYIYSKLKVES